MVETRRDGGWAWLVVVGVFINVMFLDGTIVTFGILYPHILAEFCASPTITSLTGSLIPFGLMFSSPFGAALIKRYDCRRVNFLGAFIASASILISTTCKSIGPFAITYGAMTGIGIGMISLSGYIIINSYFCKDRGVANGIVSSGAGVGVFTMSTPLQYLLQHYTWRGTLVIYSACILHVCISACLMRPIDIITNMKESEDKESNFDELMTIDIQNETGHANRNLLKSTTVSKAGCVKVDGNGTSYSNSLPTLSANYGKVDCVDADLIDIDLDIPNPRDIFYRRSMNNLSEFQIRLNKEYVLTQITRDRVRENCEGSSDSSKSCCAECRSRTVGCTDLSVFRYKVFTPLPCAAVLWQMGQFIPSTFLPDYCYHIGLTENDVTILMSIFGGMNIVGRLTAGLFSNMKAVPILWLNIFGNIMCGIACALFPLCKTFIHMCVYIATFGYFIGLNNLTSVMGIYEFVKAPAALFGPPLAGVMYKITSDYSMTVTSAAVLFLAASTCQLFVPLISCLSGRKSTRT